MLTGRVCFITGASRGIGQAIAIKYAASGATLIIHATKEENLTSTFAQLATNHKQTHYRVCGDFNQREGILAVCEAVKRITDKIDLIVHNAALLGPGKTKIEDYPVDVFEQVMRVNMKAPFVLTKELLPLLRLGENSSLIFVTSRVGQKGLHPLEGWGAYSMSKFAIESLAGILAGELQETEPRIHVNIVNPGATRTEMRALAFPKEDPLTLPTPMDITPVFEFLARKDLSINNKYLNARDWINIDPFVDSDKINQLLQ